MRRVFIFLRRPQSIWGKRNITPTRNTATAHKTPVHQAVMQWPLTQEI